MTALTTEEVRVVVRDENVHIEKSLSRVADSLDEMGRVMIEIMSSSRENDQKIIRIHERLDVSDQRINEQMQSLLTLSTDVIPGIEQEVAKNSLSSAVFWKFMLGVIIPISTSLGAVLYLFQQSQKTQMSSLISAIKSTAGL